MTKTKIEICSNLHYHLEEGIDFMEKAGWVSLVVPAANTVAILPNTLQIAKMHGITWLTKRSGFFFLVGKD